MTLLSHPLAVVTGASSGIGLELARCCARSGDHLVVAADEPAIHAAADELRTMAVMSAEVLAQQHRHQAAPGTAEK